MRYCSTRDAALQKSAHEVILEGIAPDGGLYVPCEIPKIDVKSLLPLSYAERAKRIFAAFLDDYSDEELEDVVRGAYAPGRFDEEGVCPMAQLHDDLFVMELFHGPTLAFKDVALQAMPRLLPLAAKKSGSKNEILILVATSGDTGKAALEGFCDVPGTRIVVFYPKDGVSRAQFLQMATQNGENTHVVAVEGNFDDCQRGVKQLFTDAAFEKEMTEQGETLSSANSINWARLMPQIGYYFSTYVDLVNEEKIAMGDPVNFVVPTGNFGDILAGEFARLMGLPVGKLVCASNSNDVLVDFFQKGEYDSRRPFYKTVSPSMDILVSSNLERLLFLRTRDDAFVRDAMERLSSGGAYDCRDLMRVIGDGFYSGRCGEKETLAEIRHIFDEYGYCIDPHTAVAMHVCEEYQKTSGDNGVTVVLSTASPFKFTDAVLRALGKEPAGDMFAQAKQLAEIAKLPVPAPITALENAPIRHERTCAADKMGDAVREILGK